MTKTSVKVSSELRELDQTEIAKIAGGYNVFSGAGGMVVGGMAGYNFGKAAGLGGWKLGVAVGGGMAAGSTRGS